MICYFFNFVCLINFDSIGSNGILSINPGWQVLPNFFSAQHEISSQTAHQVEIDAE